MKRKTMPNGLTSITVPDVVHDRITTAFENRHDHPVGATAKNLTEYVTVHLRQALMKIHGRSMLERIYADDDRVAILDKMSNHVVEVIMNNGLWRCLTCNRNDCMHVGFAYAVTGRGLDVEDE